MADQDTVTPTKVENGQTLFKNTFCRAKNEWLSAGMVKRGLFAGAIRPEDVPKDVMKAVEDLFSESS